MTETLEDQFDAIAPGDVVTVSRMDNSGVYHPIHGRARLCSQASLGTVLLDSGIVATLRNFVSMTRSAP